MTHHVILMLRSSLTVIHSQLVVLHGHFQIKIVRFLYRFLFFWAPWPRPVRNLITSAAMCVCFGNFTRTPQWCTVYALIHFKQRSMQEKHPKRLVEQKHQQYHDEFELHFFKSHPLTRIRPEIEKNTMWHNFFTTIH